MASAAGERFERLSTADASNIAIDAPDQVNAFLMAGVLAPGGAVAADGSVDLEVLRSALAERVPRAKRLGQRVRRDGRCARLGAGGTRPRASRARRRTGRRARGARVALRAPHRHAAPARPAALGAARRARRRPGERGHRAPHPSRDGRRLRGRPARRGAHGSQRMRSDADTAAARPTNPGHRRVRTPRSPPVTVDGPVAHARLGSAANRDDVRAPRAAHRSCSAASGPDGESGSPTSTSPRSAPGPMPPAPR